MDKTSDIDTLNTLIATTLDSMKGYRDASEDSATKNAALFSEMASERSKVASDLQTQVRALGGDPEDDSSILGALHRGFMNLKDMVTGQDEAAIVNEVERGEDYIKGKFETALNDGNLSAASRSVVETAFTSIKTGHDKMSALKHSIA